MSDRTGSAVPPAIPPPCRVDLAGDCASGDERDHTAQRSPFELREEPSALEAHTGICAAGEWAGAIPRKRVMLIGDILYSLEGDFAAIVQRDGAGRIIGERDRAAIIADLCSVGQRHGPAPIDR